MKNFKIKFFLIKKTHFICLIEIVELMELKFGLYFVLCRCPTSSDKEIQNCLFVRKTLFFLKQTVELIHLKFYTTQWEITRLSERNGTDSDYFFDIFKLFFMNEFYSHKPNTYSYREVNSYIQHIKFCTCVGKSYNYTN